MNTAANVSWLTVFANKQCVLASTFAFDNVNTLARGRRQAQLTKPSRKPPPRCKTGLCSGGQHRKAVPSQTRSLACLAQRPLHHAQPSQPPRQQRRRQQQRCWSLRPRPLQCCSYLPFFLSKPLLHCQSVSPRDHRRSQHGSTFIWGFD